VVEDDVNAEDDEAAEEDALAQPAAPQPLPVLSPRKATVAAAVAWTGAATAMAAGCTFYRSAPLMLRALKHVLSFFTNTWGR
jgi:hypothetical protein